MKTWKVRFSVGNIMPTETIVRAISIFDAKQLVIAQYPMSKVSIFSCVEI